MDTLSHHEAGKLLASFGIHIPQGRLIKSKNEAVLLAKKIGFPVVLKVSSKKILHKTDVNGVILGINDIHSLESAYDQMSRKFNTGDISGFILQKMHFGHNVIVGMKRDRQFGPIIIFGLGGIYVELIKDISYRIAPIKVNEAMQMISEIKMFPALNGARGGIKADIKKLAELISRLSILSIRNPGISEIDLNPVIVNEKEAVAVDARLVR